MKTIILSFALLAGVTASAQEVSTKKNVAKVNLSAFAFKGVGIQYERQISKRFTAAVGYSSIPESSIGFRNAIEDAVDNSSVKIGDFKLGTSIFTPEVRFYTGKRGAFHGFYLAPYARFGTYKINGPVAINTTGIIGNRNVNFDGKINAVTGGLMLGSQFKLSSRFYLDWWIVGASVGSANGNMVAVTTLNPQEQAELKNQLDNIEVPFTTIESTVNSTGATVRTTGSMAGARGLGINIGFRF